MDALTFLFNNQIFTIEEFRSALGMNKRNNTLKNLLNYHVRKGHIIRIRKGLYYTIPKGADPKTHPIDPYLIAGKMTPDAILAYQTALGFHGKLHSLRNDFIYVTQTKLKPSFVFRGNTCGAPRKLDSGIRNKNACKVFLRNNKLRRKKLWQDAACTKRPSKAESPLRP
jgi:putative AbiEi antitoxin of type IV toxin-antitoxin system